MCHELQNSAEAKNHCIKRLTDEYLKLRTAGWDWSIRNRSLAKIGGQYRSEGWRLCYGLCQNVERKQ